MSKQLMNPAPWLADKVEHWPIERLLPYARNARTHSDEQIKQLAHSIEAFGFTNSVLVDASGVIIAGHGRVLAARSLALKSIPVMIAVGWTEAQVRAYRLADNQLALKAGWDEDLLKIELGELKKLDFDLGLTGFDETDLAAIFAETRPQNSDPDEVPELRQHPVPKVGDVWLLRDHRLVVGDATEPGDVGLCVDGIVPRLMVTDPPYGVSYDPAWRRRAGVNKGTKLGKLSNDDRADWREAWALFPGDVAYVWHAGLHAAIVADGLLASGLLLRGQIIWAKHRFALSRGDYHWQHEPCWYAVRNRSHWKGDRAQSTLWTIEGPDDAATMHPTQKPIECMRRPLLNNSSPGDVVYDPFVGSGTTIIAAEMSGRCCRAIELDPIFADVAIRRWQEFTGEEAYRESDGRSFGAVDKEMSDEG